MLKISYIHEGFYLFLHLRNRDSDKSYPELLILQDQYPLISAMLLLSELSRDVTEMLFDSMRKVVDNHHLN